LVYQPRPWPSSRAFEAANYGRKPEVQQHKEIRGRLAYDKYDNYDAIEVPFTDAIQRL
jgi:hypothetical protein